VAAKCRRDSSVSMDVPRLDSCRTARLASWPPIDGDQNVVEEEAPWLLRTETARQSWAAAAVRDEVPAFRAN
jgi:hypothetical protein